MQEMNKAILRKTLRQKRLSQDPLQAAQDSARIRQHLLDLEQIRLARSVMLYLSFQGEVDTWPLLEHFWSHSVQVLLPRCQPACPGHMDVHAVRSRAELGPGSFGLTEPRPAVCPPIDCPTPDVVLVPALGYDLHGWRLGFGGGYYDRFLPALPKPALLVGLAFDFQILEEVPHDPWDIPVHILLTPATTYRISEGL